MAIAAILTIALAAQTGKIPPLSYVCPMVGDEEVIEDKPGRCRKCGMELVGVRLDSVWTCPIHAAINRDQPGKCPLDGRALVPMTMAVTWVCPGSSRESLEPGTCANGSPMQKKYTARAHGNHNPQHGGSFFMAPDNWHHLEGAYFPPGVFRLYLYDDFTRPLSVAQVRATKARVILPVAGKEFSLARNGRFLEAKVGKLAFPAALQAKVRFRADAPEHHFDFTFEKYSRDEAVLPALTMSTPSTSAGSESNPPALPSASPPSIDEALLPQPIPETIPEMLAQLRTRNDQIRMFIERGAFASVYVPAFQAKDVALALDAKKTELPAERQKILGPAVSRLVRHAYLLDAYGDLGNRQQIAQAYQKFAEAVRDIEAVFPK